MALDVFENALILVHQYDVSADHNEVSVEAKVDMLPVDAFGTFSHKFFAGMREYEVQGKGYIQFDDSTTPPLVDKILNDTLGQAAGTKVMTVAADTADGSTAYVLPIVSSEYTRDLKVTDVGKFEFKTKCAGAATRGILALPLAARTAGGTGTITQLGALSASQKMICNLHVTAFTGTNLTVLVRSNDTNNTTTPTTRATFTTVTGVTAEQQIATGAITDTYWYIEWSGTFTSATFAVAIGVR